MANSVRPIQTGDVVINQGNNVPEKKVVIFPEAYDNLDQKRINKLFYKPKPKREWFTKREYRCLPLTIANQIGFVIVSEFDVTINWNGGDDAKDLTFHFDRPIEEINQMYPKFASLAGRGIFSIFPPFNLRTPPGVNMMTMNPPNVIIPNVTVLTGMVETDNLRRNFSFNMKIDTPNVPVHIKAGTPISSLVPVPRYYLDAFEIEYAENVFSQELIEEERQTERDSHTFRLEIDPLLPNHVSRHYWNGVDVYGNPFPDHQKP